MALSKTLTVFGGMRGRSSPPLAAEAGAARAGRRASERSQDHAMEGRAHRVQCVFTEVASARAKALGMELHFSFPAGSTLPQVGDFIGLAGAGARSRFVVREREFLWDGEGKSEGPSVVLLMLDLPEQQWGESADEHRPVEVAEHER